MSLYLDTSAVAKALRPEPGHETVTAVLRDPDRVATSVIAYAETCAALARSSAALDLIASARQELERLWGQMHRIPLDDAAARSAGDAALRHRLRGMDAIHLAAALAWAASVATPVTFVSWDREQRDAARAEGFALLPEVL
ncbi:MAG: type II toxin-antitoxin system VapC family toxin [Chloroflexi bacterium]|nr:type II toxin-antitoxin system VapC family toxin [Chloroflexota bacterium]